MGFLGKLLKKLSGWKTILGYLIAQFAGSYPMLATAFFEWMAHKNDTQAIENLIAQLVLAGGVFARFIKNLKAIRAGVPVA